MTPDQPRRTSESQQEQLDALSTQVADTKADVQALQTRAEKATSRASKSEHLASAQSGRVDRLEDRADVHEALIATLQADGSLNKDQAAQLEQALRSSRVIGAAIGIIMVKRDVSDFEAFKVLDKASQETNRKLRAIAEEVVRTRGLDALTRLSVDAV